MTLTSRERVLLTLDHEEPDRVPIFIGASNALSMHLKPYRELKRLLGIEAADRFLYDWPELGAIDPDEKTLERLHSDVRGVHDRHPQSTYEKNAGRNAGAPFFDSWGIGQVQMGPDSWFPAIHPLEDATSIADLENFAWPDMSDPSRIAHVREHAAKLMRENQYAILATPWLLFPFERAIGMQGMEQFFVNLASDPDLAKALLEKCAALCKELMGRFLAATGDNIDIIKIGDDLGTTSSLLISPKMYRDILKPIHADYIAFIKERTHARLFFHTDGNVFPLLDDFVEIGVDILNPIQTSAGEMADLARIKQRYGEQLTFCGAIDTSRILPFGAPEEVRQETKRVIEILGPGGGYIVAAVHSIQRDVPAENILAMVDATLEFGQYPLA